MTTADRRRWPALYVLCAGMLMNVLDTTIVNVALPSMARDLHFSQAELAWVINAYVIAFGGLLLLAGRIGDVVGHRRMFLSGLGVFTASSLACALAPTKEILIAARFVQGVGGALASAVILGMIVSMFPEPAARAKALGVYGFVASAGGSIGLLAGGVLTSRLDWHWIFLINVPIGVVTALLAVRYVPAHRGCGSLRQADGVGAALLTAALMSGVYAIVGISQQPPALLVTLGAVSVALLVAFVIRQAKVANPLVPLRLFRSRTLVGANVVQALVMVGMFGGFFLGALYLQDVRGYGPLDVGLAFLPMTIAMAVMTLWVAGRVTTRLGAHRTLMLSFVLLVAGLLLYVRMPVGGTYLFDIAPPMVLAGIGAGLGFPALTGLGMSTATGPDAGLVSGLFNTTVQVGAAIGLAVLAAVSSGVTSSLRAAGWPGPDALLGGYHVAYVVSAVAALAALVVVAVVLRRSPSVPEPELALVEA
ncbi:MAG TPA: MFS transporter [Pseudonocardiaceae bacterium]|nr:MFS transporter [Pseudonocardiaceae bacterium]